MEIHSGGRGGAVRVQPRLEPMAQASKRNNNQNFRFGISARLNALRKSFSFVFSLLKCLNHFCLGFPFISLPWIIILGMFGVW